MAQNTYSGFSTIQQKWVERIGRLGEPSEAYRFQHLDQNMFRAWRETYEKEFQQFFRIPQLGLMRSYQEKLQQALDKYAVSQSTMAEFIRVLCLPLNRSIAVLDEKLAELAKTGKLPEDSKDYYRLWVKILEGHYMSLYQSSEYLEILSKTIASLTDYANARNAVFEDMLSLVPIPSRKEIDDLEREVFELKNRLKAVEAGEKKRSPAKQAAKQDAEQHAK
jgi:class III poly(R)-hydroxyalkanoic acid synthase PhaE subunit